MAIYSANKPNRTLTIHKEDCTCIDTSVKGCGCISTGKHNNQQWLCEDHISQSRIDSFMGNRFWSILICSKCF